MTRLNSITMTTPMQVNCSKQSNISYRTSCGCQFAVHMFHREAWTMQGAVLTQDQQRHDSQPTCYESEQHIIIM